MLLVVLLLQSCGRQEANSGCSFSLDYYKTLGTASYRVDSRVVRESIRRIIKSDADSMVADKQAKSYYLKGNSFVWIDRLGVDSRADTLLAYLRTVEADGLSANRFCVGLIEADLNRMRTLDFDSCDNDINHVAGRLEYRLTKAFLRFAMGNRYGFVNPFDVFNRLDPKDDDSVYVSYHQLFDIRMQLPKKGFCKSLLRLPSADSLGTFLASLKPQNPLYYTLCERLALSTLTRVQREKILVNMERCRWRLDDYPHLHDRYVLVNIPSFMLRAVDGDSIFEMKIGCGSLKTKTPLLTSRIKRMDLNPQWIIPKSIIRNDIVRHAGSESYFSSHRYFIRERKTGKKMAPEDVSAQMLLSGDYLVIQEGGAGNALGRIIFRFDNNFSVYLHDTSSPSVFSRADRGVSHGCVRVERPMDLARYLLAEQADGITEKLFYTVTADVSPLGKKRAEMTAEQAAVADTLRKNMLVKSLNVEPPVPLYITYYTLYPSSDGTLADLPDVYGYDKVIAKYLRNYL